MAELPTSRAHVRVRLIHPLKLPDGNMLPRTLEGTVLAVWPDGMEVEFATDKPIVATVPNAWLELIEEQSPGADGECWAIVECLSHQTLVGRVHDAEAYGARGIMIEPLCDGRLLSPVFRAAAALYGVTPCSREQALAQAPRHAWMLPEAVRALLPPETAPPPRPDDADDDDLSDEVPFDDDADRARPAKGTRVTLLHGVDLPSAGLVIVTGSRGRVVGYEPDGRIAVEFPAGILTFDVADLAWERNV